MSLSLVMDNTSNLIAYGGCVWSNSSSPRWFGGSSEFPNFNGSHKHDCTVSLSFQGTSIAFWGAVSTIAADLNTLTLSIDGDNAYSATFNPSRQTWQQWYQSPVLEEGTHQIKFSHIGQAMDVAIITTGQHSALPGQAAIIDNENPAIAYSGSWQKSTDAINSDSTTFPIMFPIGNSTSRSTTVGDSLTFQFTGTSVTVWGVDSKRFAGTLKVEYTIDGGTPVKMDYSVTSAKNVRDVSNAVMFTQNGLISADHVLTLKVTACVHQTFIFDYVTYIPSFLTAIPPSMILNKTFTSSGSGPASSTKSASPSQVLSPNTSTETVTVPGPAPITSSDSNSVASASSSSSSAASSAVASSISASTASQGPPLRLIIGVVCSVIALLILALLFWHRRRHRRSASRTRIAVPFDPSQIRRIPPTHMAVRQEKAVIAATSRNAYTSADLGFADTGLHQDGHLHVKVAHPDIGATVPPPAYKFDD